MHVVVGLDPEGEMYLLDLWRKRIGLGRVGRSVLRSREEVEADGLGSRDGADQIRRWPVPASQAARAAGIRRHRDSSRRAATRRCGRNRSAAAWRWRAFTSRSTRLGIADLRAELMAFPAGKHDDQVDALGWSASSSIRCWSAKETTPKEKPKRDAWEKAYLRQHGETRNKLEDDLGDQRWRNFKRDNPAIPAARPKVVGERAGACASTLGKAIQTLVRVMKDAKAPPAAQALAANSLLDRGYGRPAQSVDLTTTRKDMSQMSDA